jgi:hypothetical protein
MTEAKERTNTNRGPVEETARLRGQGGMVSIMDMISRIQDKDERTKGQKKPPSDGQTALQGPCQSLVARQHGWPLARSLDEAVGCCGVLLELSV